MFDFGYNYWLEAIDVDNIKQELKLALRATDVCQSLENVLKDSMARKIIIGYKLSCTNNCFVGKNIEVEMIFRSGTIRKWKN